MKNIPLTQGMFAVVDNADFEFLSRWKWSFGARRYARTQINGKKVYMHRLLNKTPKGFHTDHINRDTLDNRKSNLRTATCSQNIHNSKIQHNNSSGHRGIYWYERYKKWEVYINVKGKRIYLKRFSPLEDAIRARKQAEKKYL